MARQMVPLAKAKLTGVAAKNPQRFRDRSEPESGPLGSPPAFLTKDQKRAWRDFTKEWGWLTESDRAALVPLCVLRAKIESGEDVPVSAFTEYRLQISAFGGTPTTKTKVFQTKSDEDDDPFAEFVN